MMHISLYTNQSNRLKNKLSFIALLLGLSLANTILSGATPWSAPVALSNTGLVTSNVFSAATNAGYMAVWAQGTNAYYSFSTDGASWHTGAITSATADVVNPSDVFVAGNNNGFIVTWIDASNNGWSSFTSNNGQNWSAKIKINGSLTLDSNSDVFVAGGASGFVATMIDNNSNAYISFSNGTTVWSTPLQITNDGSVSNINLNSKTGNGFISATISKNSCMLSWLNGTTDETDGAYLTSINPFLPATPTVYPIIHIGFLNTVPVSTVLNGYFMSVVRANTTPNQTYFSTATTPTNWATFSCFAPNPTNLDAGPWVAANQNGFICIWTNNGNPVWTLSTNNGFNWTTATPILVGPSTSATIFAPIGLSANGKGFIATWLDTADSNAYATFYATPPTVGDNIFVNLLQQKYNPIL